MKYKVKVYSIWEFGQRVDAQGNPHQEDSLFPAHNKATDKDRLFILCDGMGGHDAGEVASATVCEAMSRSVLENVSDPEGRFTDEDLQRAIADAFDALDRKDSGAVKKMGTTMTFLKLHDRGATIAHMGDSRVYHIRPGKDRNSTRILHVTSDHSLVNDLIRIGELTPEEAAHSRQKNVITRAMQPNMERRPRADVYHTADIRPGDYFYMCSDGMLEQMEDRYAYSADKDKPLENEYLQFHFCADGKSDEEIVRRLTDATRENRDNHTAIIVHILEVSGVVPTATGGAGEAVPALLPLMAEVEDGEETLPVEVPERGAGRITGGGTPADDGNRAVRSDRVTPGRSGVFGEGRRVRQERRRWCLMTWIYKIAVFLILAVAGYYVCTHFDGIKNKVSSFWEPEKTSRKEVTPAPKESDNQPKDTISQPSQPEGTQVAEPPASVEEPATPSQPGTGNAPAGQTGSVLGIPVKTVCLLSEKQAATDGEGTTESDTNAATNFLNRSQKKGTPSSIK